MLACMSVTIIDMEKNTCKETEKLMNKKKKC